MTATPFEMERLGVVMEVDPSRPQEREGVLNPAATRGPDGTLYLFPRVVGRGNYSRIGIARVRFDVRGEPVDVERVGYALEPEEPYELRPAEGTGGCEDPRVTYVEPLGLYVMVYVAWGADGPRLALAISHDVLSWQRLGLVNFEPDPDPLYKVIFDDYHNKNGTFFPEAVRGPHGRPSLALVHRPVYDTETVPSGVRDPRPSIWLSYCSLDAVQRDVRALTTLREHHMLINPQYEQQLRIGGGTPPLRTALGWLLIYHGVQGYIARAPGDRQWVCYGAGALVLAANDVRRVLYRSPAPILTPTTDEELRGVVPRVVFPTGVDDRGDGRVDVYYGMADQRIGAATLRIPSALPHT